MNSTLRTDDPWSRSQWFTVRVWHDRKEPNVQEVRIRVRHVLTGETRCFGSGWHGLPICPASSIVNRPRSIERL